MTRDDLVDAVVLTPTRRGARSLAEAFVAVGGGRAMLLPQIRALGDLDEGEPPFEPGELALDLPPAITPWRRRFELARLVAEHEHLLERTLDAVGALELADALAGFLDSLADRGGRAAARPGRLGRGGPGPPLAGLGPVPGPGAGGLAGAAGASWA